MRIAVKCLVLPVEAAYTEPGLTFAIAFLCSQPPLPSSLPKDSGLLCQGELKFPENTPRTRDGCHSADTALIHPSTSPGVRLLGAHKTWEKARCSSPRAVSLEMLSARDLG